VWRRLGPGRERGQKHPDDRRNRERVASGKTGEVRGSARNKGGRTRKEGSKRKRKGEQKRGSRKVAEKALPDKEEKKACFQSLLNGLIIETR